MNRSCGILNLLVAGRTVAIGTQIACSANLARRGDDGVRVARAADCDGGLLDHRTHLVALAILSISTGRVDLRAR